MKISIPNDLEPLDASALLDGASIERAELSDADCEGLSTSGIDINLSTIERGSFAGTRFRQFILHNVRISGSLLFGANWDGTHFKNVELSNVAASGIALTDAGLTGVRLQSCKLNLANFRQSTLVDIEFIDCQLQEADFMGATLRNVRFVNCELEGVTFSGATLSKVDLTENDISELKDLLSLKGAEITTTQLFGIAPNLAL